MEDPAILESKWRLNFELRKIKLMSMVGRYDGMDDAKRLVENALLEILKKKSQGPAKTLA